MVIHVRYDGHSVDLPFHQADLGDLSTDRDIRQAVAGRLNEECSKFNQHVIDRNTQTGNITLRPQAVFG